jgi:ABC-type dipeptide/oligopeptide/nickel transport system ATPase subunit
MALLNEILKWTESDLPIWQRDAVRRLFQKENDLSQSDYQELFILMMLENGLLLDQKIQAEPLNASHLPVSSGNGPSIILKSLKDLKHVNCIAFDQKLNFEPEGITTIYGGNGSGKSGYTRVMKHACRCRDQKENVHPNANDPNFHSLIPQATFEIVKNGSIISHTWIRGSTPPDDLSTVAVFDGHCARAFLTSENDVAFLPYGLDIVENLATDVIPRITSILENEISKINTDASSFKHLLGNTEVGQLISTLGIKTDLDKLKKLATLSDQEVAHLAEIQRVLAEKEPKVRATEIIRTSKRYKDAADRIDAVSKWVSDSACAKLKTMEKNTKEAIEAERKAAEILCAGEILLPGTGDSLWRLMFESARRYSQEVAYVGKSFPNIEKDSVCVLCQQPLGESSHRIERFENYVQADVSKIASAEREKLSSTKTKIENADLSANIDGTFLEELGSHDLKIPLMIQDFLKSIQVKRDWMLSALESQNWENEPQITPNPRNDIRKIAAKLLRSARMLLKTIDISKRVALQRECSELGARQNLALCSEEVLDLVKRIKKSNDLLECKSKLKTRPISEKAKDFASSSITLELGDSLDEEFKNLGIGYIKTKLKERYERAKVKHRLVLDLPTASKIEEILSEGEQRAIAIGSFLAELKLSEFKGPIVFDDPVSSLDHKFRDRVAKRLAFEGAKRQVIMFTHDLVFLHQLRDQCELQKVKFATSFLEPIGKTTGCVRSGLPWGHKSYKEKIDYLEKRQKEFEKLPWPESPSEELTHEIIHEYNFLRATIERVVEDVVLCGTVKRFTEYIRVDSLRELPLLQECDVKGILELYHRCSGIIDAHDSASAINEPPPTAADLGNDLNKLKSLIECVKSRRNN